MTYSDHYDCLSFYSRGLVKLFQALQCAPLDSVEVKLHRLMENGRGTLLGIRWLGESRKSGFLKYGPYLQRFVGIIAADCGFKTQDTKSLIICSL